MIILDEADEPQKFPSDDSHSVRRATTPSPSLPDYEASQSQAQHREPQQQQGGWWWHRHSKARMRRAAIYGLIVYFIVTVVVGVPVIVVKLHHHGRQSIYSPQPAIANTPSLIVDGSDIPFLESFAVGCNDWVDEDTNGGNLSQSNLQYMIPLSGLVFLQSNVSYPTDAAEFQMLSGTLAVGINDDPTVSDALVSVSMLYSDVSLKDRTSVCLMNISNSNGLYLYVPSNLSESDTLIFNITFLFPQTLSLHVSEFLTWLPHFTQWFTNLTPYVTFDKVTLGGPMSEVIVGSIQASSALVKSALAEIQGNFNVSESLILETVSAPIAANISLYNSGGYTEITYLSVSTGNAPLNASIALYLPPGSSHCAQSPNFLANVETFNAPLALALSHMPASMPAAVQLRAGTNLGEAVVSVDGKFSGTFNVQTTFADADVLEATVPDIDMAQFDISLYSSALRDTSQASPASSGSSPDVGKVVDFDVISSSQMSGWVGTGKRPPKPQNGPNGQGSVEVSSTLSSVALLLGP